MSSPSAAPATAELLAGLPLFAGIPADELAAIGEVMRTASAPAGEDLWREGDESDGLYVIVSGRASVVDELPAARELELATLGPGGVLGEIPLLGGGPRWATVRAVQDTRCLVLGRNDLAALLARATPGALTVRQRLLALLCDRLRQRHAALADSLGAEPAEVAAAPDAAAAAADAPAPDVDYVLRLPFFRGFDRSSVVDVLARARAVELPRSQLLLAEGQPASGCWITLNGGVEELIRRGEAAIRVCFDGPGEAFGYLGLIDGLPSSVTAATRERSRLLFLPPDVFAELFDPTALDAAAFREAVERDLTRTLRVSLRPQARLETARGPVHGR